MQKSNNDTRINLSFAHYQNSSYFFEEIIKKFQVEYQNLNHVQQYFHFSDVRGNNSDTEARCYQRYKHIR